MSVTETASGLAVVEGGLDVVISQTQYEEFIGQTALRIVNSYDPDTTDFRALLDGGAAVLVDLCRAIDDIDKSYHPASGFVKSSAYGNDRVAKEVAVHYLEPPRRAGNDVVLVDELLDTGGQMDEVAKQYKSHPEVPAGNVEAVTVATKGLVHSLKHVDKITSGFTVPNRWLEGMGLNGPGGRGRWRRFMYVVNE